MTSVAVDLMAVFLAGVCLYRAELVRPLGCGIHEDYLSSESGKYARGLLSLVVMFHHLAQSARGVVLFPIFAKLGYLAVSVFFFLSGFGLMKQYMGRQNYGRQFLLRRLPSILVPYLLATALYWLLYRILGEPWSLRGIFRGIVSGTPIVTASWYIICILLFYIAFRVLMLLCGRRYAWMVAGAVVYCGLYVAFCVYMGYGSWWYNTVPVLVFGMVWALNEQKINGFFQKHYRIAAPVVFVLFAAVYGVKIFLNSRVGIRMVAVPMTWCAAVLFALCVLLVLMKLKLRNPLLRWLGDLSLEIYLSHYFFIQLLRWERFPVRNDFLFVILVLLCTLIFSGGFHWLNRRILKQWNGLLERGRNREISV